MLSLTGAKKSSSLAVRPKTSMIPAAKISNSKKTVGSKSNYLQSINVKVLEIESMITTKLIRETTKSFKDKRKAQKEDRNEQEKDLEKGKDPGKKNIKIPKVPKLGMFGWLKRFIGSVILAFFANKMLNHLPKLVGLVKGIQSVIEFVTDIGITLINALATFVDWGYKAYDATRGFLKTIGGNGLAENFDKVLGLVDTALFLTTALAGSMAIDAMTGGDGGGFDPLDFFRKKGAQKAAGKVAAKGGAKVAAKGTAAAAGTAAAIVAGVGLLSSALGEGAFQLRKIGKGLEGGAKKRYEEKGPFDPRKPLDWLLYQGARFINHNLNGLGILLDIVGAPFRYAIELINFGIMAMFGDKEGMKRQRKNLAKFDARVREGVRQLLNVATLGFGFKEKGSFGNIFGDEAATKEMVSKMQEGGVAGNRTKVKRRLKKRRGTFNINRLKKPVFRPLPTAPRGDIKNKDGQPNRAWWDFLGWAGSSDGNLDISESGSKLGKRVSEVGNTLGKNDYFGPLLSLTSKVILNKDIESQDYDNVGLGINRLLNEGILKRQVSEGISGYAEGGKVASALASGIDASSWVSDTFKKELSSDIKKQYEKIGVAGSTSGPGSTPGSRDSATGGLDGYMSGPAGSSGDALTMARNLMRDLNLTEAQAAGIVGNMIAESGVENARPQNTPGGTKGPLVVDDKTGYGIVQWTSRGRQQALYDFAVSKGHDMSKPLTMDLEYQFFLKEFQGDYGYVLNQIRQAKDVKGSSTIFMQQYEVPAGYRTEAKIMERYNMSQPVYKKLSSGQGTATEGEGTYIAPQNVTAPDLSGTEQGEGTEASNRLLKDYPQIKSRGSAQQIYASGLGYFLKKSGAGRPGKGDFGDPPQPGADMEHPDHGQVRASHSGTGHKRGVALDLGGNSATSSGYNDDQKKLWPYISRFLKQYGLNKDPFIPQVIHGIGESFSPVGPSSGPDGGHNDHFHVEFHDGGMVGGNGVVNSLLKTGEIVIDNDSSIAKVNPMLLAINAAKDEKGVMKAISDYAPYELGAQQTVLVNNNNQAQPMDDYGTQDQGLAVMMANSYDNSFEFLDYQG